MKIYDDQYIIITGAAGFIGSNLVRYLNDKNYRNLILVDALREGDKWKNLVGKKFLDFIPIEDLFQWLQGREREVEAIIHLGACTNTTEVDADYLIKNNYRYSVRLAEYALTHQIRFLYASSAATYGDGSNGFLDDVDRLEYLQPMNMYGYSKHLFDLWLKNEEALDQVVGFKFFNVFGPNEWHKGKMASAILHMLPTIKKDGVVKLFRSNDPKNYADGEQKRDFIYVKDVVRMIYAFLGNSASGIYNIGSGIASSWRDLATCLFQSIKLSPNIEFVDMPNELKDKYQNYTLADVNKTQQVLNDQFSITPLQEAVSDYVTQHLLPVKRW